MLIRLMQETDSPDVASLFFHCFSEPWSENAIKEMFHTEGYYNLVAADHEKIYGYIGIKAVLDEADIVNVAVLPSYRGQHLATKLLEQLLTDIRKKGIQCIYLEVREHNAPAIKLYENAGFIVNGLRKNYYDNPKENALLMMWEER